MHHSESYIQDANQNKIFRQSWLPKNQAKAIILLAHGMSEHSGRYSNLVEHLLPLDYAVYSWDHIGHGRSDGHRKFISDFTDFTDVLTEYLQEIQQQHPDLPIYLFGHSMGGLIATHYLLDHQHAFRGAMISAPALKVYGGVSPFTVYAGKILSAVFPKFGLESFNRMYICRDSQVLESAENDPLMAKGKTPVRLLAELLDAMERVENEAHHISLPILIIQGTDDQIVDPAGADMLHQLASSEDKTLKVYPGLYHELINEPEKDEVLADISGWLERVHATAL